MSHRVISGAIVVGIIGGIVIDVLGKPTLYEVPRAEAVEEVKEPERILIGISYNWTEERIIKEIRDTFPEIPGLATAIARCESGLIIDVRSRGQVWYGQERSFGLMQIHEPDHHEEAIALGFEEYKTNPKHNLGYARHLYEKRGWEPWSCFTSGEYKKYL